MTTAERRARRNHAARIARAIGFEGLVEYRHVYSQTTGAQSRHPQIAPRLGTGVSIESEEILASLLGVMISPSETDRDALVAKATVDLLTHVGTIRETTRQLQRLWNLLEALL